MVLIDRQSSQAAAPATPPRTPVADYLSPPTNNGELLIAESVRVIIGTGADLEIILNGQVGNYSRGCDPQFLLIDKSRLPCLIP